MFVLALSAGPLAGTAGAAPVPVTAPVLSATTAHVGTTLTVTPGTYAAPPASVSDAWERCTTAPTPICTPVGTTGPTYTVTYADVNDTIMVLEMATNSDMTTTPQNSNSTTAIPGPPTNTRPPAIAGSPPPIVGNTLTATQGTWTSADPGSITDTWEDCDGATCTPISGSTTTTATASHKVTAGDVGHTIKVMETATNGGTPANPAVFSQPTVVATYPQPTISGTAVQGQTLIASATDSTSVEQWQACDSTGHGCANISGANRSTYTLTANEVGSTIVVIVNGVTSAATDVVQTTSTVSLTAAPNDPVTNQGVTLVATVTSQAAAGLPSGAVAFLDSGTVVSGCEARPVPASGQSVTVLCQTASTAETAQLTAVFTPAAGSLVLGSSSTGQTLNIGQATTTTALDASSRVPVQASTTYTATVAPAADRTGPIMPSGSVQFLDGGKPMSACAAQRLSGGGATCTVKYASTGSHSITARYLGDANFTASGSTARVVQVTALPAKGTITATMQWTFVYTPVYTRVINLVVNGVPTGATVQVLCHGRGCPFAKRSRTMGKPKRCSRKQKHSCPVPGRMSLTSTFVHRHLRPGAQVAIEIRRAQYVGKYYSFTMRPRKQPRVRIACLAVNSTRPNVGC